MYELADKEHDAVLKLNAEYRCSHFREKARQQQGLYILHGADGPFLLEDCAAGRDSGTGGGKDRGRGAWKDRDSNHTRVSREESGKAPGKVSGAESGNNPGKVSGTVGGNDPGTDRGAEKIMVLPVWCHERYARDYLQLAGLEGLTVQFVSARAWNEHWTAFLERSGVLEGFMPLQRDGDFLVAEAEKIGENSAGNSAEKNAGNPAAKTGDPAAS